MQFVPNNVKNNEILISHRPALLSRNCSPRRVSFNNSLIIIRIKILFATKPRITRNCYLIIDSYEPVVENYYCINELIYRS